MHRTRAFLLVLTASGALVDPYPASAQWPPSGAPVCIHPATQLIGEIASDGAGGAYVFWGDGRDYSSNDFDGYLQRITASGAIAPGWPVTGVPVCTAPGDQYPNGIAADGEGGAIVVWEDHRTWVDPDIPHSWDIYAQKITASGTIASGWQTNGTPVATVVAFRQQATIASDGAGGAFVAWSDYRNGTRDAYALRLTAGGARPEGWPQDGLRLSDTVMDKGFVRILEDGTGGAYFAWPEGNLKALRLTAAGEIATGWEVNGNVVCTAPGDRGGIRMANDGVGGAFLAWTDGRSFPGLPEDFVYYTDVYAQRITGAGDVVAGWPVDGLVVTAIPGEVQWNVEMVADEAGGALVTWEDYRTGVPAPYVQRLTASGALASGWPPDGVRATSSPSYALGPRVAPDGLGGALIVFEVFEGSDAKLFAQHLTGAAAVAPGWSAEGTRLALSPGDQEGPRIVSDGVGGAIVAWQDGRLISNSDIYAQRFTMDGPVPALIALVGAEADPGRVTLTWFAGSGAGLLAAVERRTADSDWRRLDAVTTDGTGRLVFEDRTVAPGARYAYRLTYDDGSGPVATSEVWVEVPAQASFALHGLRPNPAVGDLVAALSLASEAPATLELFDLSGRRLLTQDVGSLGPGPHRVDLSQGMRVPAGVYSLRLVQGEKRAAIRAVVIR